MRPLTLRAVTAQQWLRPTHVQLTTTAAPPVAPRQQNDQQRRLEHRCSVPALSATLARLPVPRVAALSFERTRIIQLDEDCTQTILNSPHSFQSARALWPAGRNVEGEGRPKLLLLHGGVTVLGGHALPLR